MATNGTKTVNNVLTALSKCLKVAAEWDVMDRVPCTVRLLKVSSSVPDRIPHTFCSMLAPEGAPPLAIQELAGHSHISTTMKHMHLSPTTLETEVPSEAKRSRHA